MVSESVECLSLYPVHASGLDASTSGGEDWPLDTGDVAAVGAFASHRRVAGKSRRSRSLARVCHPQASRVSWAVRASEMQERLMAQALLKARQGLSRVAAVCLAVPWPWVNHPIDQHRTLDG